MAVWYKAKDGGIVARLGHGLELRIFVHPVKGHRVLVFGQELVTPAKPKGMAWDEWDELQDRRAAEKRARSYERIEELRARGRVLPLQPVPRGFYGPYRHYFRAQPCSAAQVDLRDVPACDGAQRHILAATVQGNWDHAKVGLVRSA